jgi:hypothetical protein
MKDHFEKQVLFRDIIIICLFKTSYSTKIQLSKNKFNSRLEKKLFIELVIKRRFINYVFYKFEVRF